MSAGGAKPGESSAGRDSVVVSAVVIGSGLGGRALYRYAKITINAMAMVLIITHLSLPSGWRGAGSGLGLGGGSTIIVGSVWFIKVKSASALCMR